MQDYRYYVLNWKEKLEAAKEAGYDFVEISIDETEEKLARLDWRKEERREPYPGCFIEMFM